MIRTVLTVAFAAVTGVAGYLGGSIYPAPPAITNAISNEAGDIRARLKLEKVDLEGFRSLVSAEKFKQLESELNSASAAAGDIIMADRGTSTPEELQKMAAMESNAPAPIPVSLTTTVPSTPKPASAAPTPAPAPTAPAVATPAPAATAIPAAVSLCPRMQVTNAPPTEADLQVENFHQLVNVDGVRLASDPAPGACLSSGFGERGTELHKGVDYHNESGGPILAAGDGVIVEMKYRDDYGNMIVVDHGNGVYTRYAHLASFSPGLSEGVRVMQGEQVGLMGNTAGYAVPVHLHYEVLLGDYNTPKKSFGLAPKNVFSFPAAS
ncbi:MAG: peptidoglycan DD-metalloendopeptidase family protein [Alphaproteobacteria bacterium]|nr:peptidoglycan DD-metalloendopeptidase family protein [Alphaproteobacteria bacterium]